MRAVVPPQRYFFCSGGRFLVLLQTRIPYEDGNKTIQKISGCSDLALGVGKVLQVTLMIIMERNP
jgi:hypothetical protein